MQEDKGGITMAVFAKPMNIALVLSEKSAKEILSATVDTKQWEKIRKEAERFKKNNVKKS